VVELTNRLLATLAVDVPPTRSLRSDGELRVSPVADVGPATVAAVTDALRQPGSIAVICTEPRTTALTAALHEAGIASTTVDQPDDGTARVTVLPATLAKGLEYDHVIVVEPAEIVDAEPRGRHRLYVVLTRAVSRLDIVHARPLPLALVG
jgi:DNA helicase IV